MHSLADYHYTQCYISLFLIIFVILYILVVRVELTDIGLPAKIDEKMEMEELDLQSNSKNSSHLPELIAENSTEPNSTAQNGRKPSLKDLFKTVKASDGRIKYSNDEASQRKQALMTDRNKKQLTNKYAKAMMDRMGSY